MRKLLLFIPLLLLGTFTAIVAFPIWLANKSFKLYNQLHCAYEGSHQWTLGLAPSEEYVKALRCVRCGHAPLEGELNDLKGKWREMIASLAQTKALLNSMDALKSPEEKAIEELTN